MVTFVLAIGWAGFTDHVWEDYFITYRASKNLAQGDGLVFQPGEKLHTFTSPLGVLLPAVAHLMAGRGSDIVTLWIFRVMGALAFAGAVTLAWAALRRSLGANGDIMKWWLLPLLLALDTKCLDYATNGMETPFLLLSFAWGLWAVAARFPRSALSIGGACALMLWSRPDAVVYIMGLAIAVLLFEPREGGASFAARFGLWVRSAVVTTALYLPWLIWSTWYYGTPIAHTIAAKGLFAGERSVGDILLGFVSRPFHMPSEWSATFLPPYAPYIEWPAGLGIISIVVAVLSCLLWVWPRFPWLVRVASFVALVGHSYLLNFVGFGVPWYYPAVAFFGLFAVGGALWHLASSWVDRPRLRRVVVWAGAALTVFLAANTVMAAQQLKWQQRLVEWGNRRVIGEWLRDHASTPTDTVFLEPLGYIGFFSQLKMLDYPGLCAPEVVAARTRTYARSYPECWHELIMALEPDWLVLRDWEIERIQHNAPDLLWVDYTRAEVFDVRDQVRAVPWVPGRAYLINDGRFTVYRRVKAKTPALEPNVFRRSLGVEQWEVAESGFQQPYLAGDVLLSHAPSRLQKTFQGGADMTLRGQFGILPGAYADPMNATDGAVFTVRVRTAAGEERVLLERALDPVEVTADQGAQALELSLPPDTAWLSLEITPGPAGSADFDWTYWQDLRVVQPLWPDGFRGTWEPAAGPAQRLD
ncbi:hypothetical protein [Actomonas aquatica]|uniref:Glycosyltransferase RgtA/B/C/D-like domain-containing protein n=1 Tax=Actomonas aquatica TaxID=2866162 RepID=A0ABZ1C5Q7_9BACT|nr:hypothetical protein [Opitutus sp. WL0086]WRQ86841.1 hypothetical protein K1X11_018675 [Opitutus sp. WL0086]